MRQLDCVDRLGGAAQGTTHAPHHAPVAPTEPGLRGHFLFEMLAETWGPSQHVRHTQTAPAHGREAPSVRAALQTPGFPQRFGV